MTAVIKPVGDDRTNKANEDPEKPNSPLVLDDEFAKVVNSMLPTTDNVNTPSLTWRVWFIGIISCVSLAYINQIFMFRTNSFSVTDFVALLLSYPFGVFLARVIPSRYVDFGFFGFDTNPGPFSVKEHVLINIFATTGAARIYGTESLVVQEVFYGLEREPFWAIMFLFTTSTLGFGISGLCQKFVIRPSHMLWPHLLPTIALFTSFHKSALSKEQDCPDLKKSGAPAEHHDPNVDENGVRHMSRLRFFGICVILSSVYYILGPGFFSPALSSLPLLCWAAPGNDLMQRLGSPMYGTGMFAMSLDLSVVGTAGITLPFWTSMNLMFSCILFMWILSPLAWTNKWFGEPLSKHALNTPALMSKEGTKLDVRKLVKDGVLDQAAYDKQKLIYMSPFFAWAYFGQMASFTASLSHLALWYGKDIWKRARASRYDEEDIHCKLIDKYKEVPNTWYYAFFAICGTLSVVTCHFSRIDMPWYYSILAIGLSMAGTLPIAVIMATAGSTIALNVISEFVIGLIEPGRPVVMMAFKCLGFTVCAQCMTLLADLKLGHYMKVPPRHIFVAQLTSQIIAVFVCYQTMTSWLDNEEHVEWIKDMGKNSNNPMAKVWGGTTPKIYFSASLIWGAIGPMRFFFESVYTGIIVGGLVIGLFTPIVLKLCYTYIGGPIPWRLINPVLLYYVGSPGGNQAQILPHLVLALVFQRFLYRRARNWWSRYNYVLSVGLDVGTAFAMLFITLGLNDYGIESPVWLLRPADGDTESMGPFQDGCYFDDTVAM